MQTKQKTENLFSTGIFQLFFSLYFISASAHTVQEKKKHFVIKCKQVRGKNCIAPQLDSSCSNCSIRDKLSIWLKFSLHVFIFYSLIQRRKTICIFENNVLGRVKQKGEREFQSDRRRWVLSNECFIHFYLFVSTFFVQQNVKINDDDVFTITFCMEKAKATDYGTLYK